MTSIENGSNNLGINGKSINPPLESTTYTAFVKDSGRFRKYDLLRTAQGVLYDGAKEMRDQHRTCWCHRGVVNTSDTVSIFRQNDGGMARVHGVPTCKSVWACPVCSAKICAVRQAELSGAMAAWIKQDGYVWLMTLTFPHEYHQALAGQLPKFTKAKAYFKNCKTYKRILSKGVRKGSVTSLEVTVGLNGWHPHQHDLVFATPDAFGTVHEDLSGSLSSALIDDLKYAWYVALLKSGLCERDQMSDVLKHGLDVRGGQYAAEYIAKFGRDQQWGLSREVTMHASKVGSDQKGAHPFQLIAWAENGDAQAMAQFREYVEAFEGKRMLSWSRGLKKALTGTDEISDEQAADLKMPEESRVGGINSEQLSVLQSRKLLSNFLNYVADYCDDVALSQQDINDYIRWARTVPINANGTVKTKLFSRGFMFTNREGRE
ncbi:protein rep [Undibacterium sp. Ren11W]|uniref:protein rep n=1 Tax=Undibacterium sp. Ren11W TaxID=3413045 RepID=UPI003BF23302